MSTPAAPVPEYSSFFAVMGASAAMVFSGIWQRDTSGSGIKEQRHTIFLNGVDPELYELTTSKLETSNTTSKVTDAFAKLMSTVEKATSSARAR